ncbi:MAG: site-2 protease family protein [candidate division Zixibacteria bacterium]|nr:site-2 protease family protein [candidate division Zixibacteria bacterium]
MKTNPKLEAGIRELIQRFRNFISVDAIYYTGDGVVLKGHIPYSAVVSDIEVNSICANTGFNCRIDRNGDSIILNLNPMEVRNESAKERKIPWINIVLFWLTFATTTLIAVTEFSAKGILDGFKYSVPLMTILVFHESGHYIASRIHKVKTSLPYFIPAPNIFGTFGAFIKSKSPFYNRRQLLDVAAAGPIAGFILSIIAIIIGLFYSDVVKMDDSLISISFGESLIFKFLSAIIIGTVPDGHDVMLHPIAFAGWAGLFVTMLNLIPYGQLDGGHILYALIGKKQRLLSWLFIFGMVTLGFYWWPWMIMAVILFILIPKHPPTIDDNIPLDRTRRITGYICLAIFILTFTPIPVNLP